MPWKVLLDEASKSVCILRFVLWVMTVDILLLTSLAGWTPITPRLVPPTIVACNLFHTLMSVKVSSFFTLLERPKPSGISSGRLRTVELDRVKTSLNIYRGRVARYISDFDPLSGSGAGNLAELTTIVRMKHESGPRELGERTIVLGFEISCGSEII